MSALLAGVALIPVSLFTVLLSARVGRVGDRISHYPLVLAGLVPFIGGLLLTVPGASDLTYVDLLPAIVAVGVGIALFRAPLLGLIHDAVPRHHVGTGIAAGELVAGLGGVMGVAIGVTVFLSVATPDFNAKGPAIGIQHHFTDAELRTLWSNPAPVIQRYRALPELIRLEVRKIVIDTANDALSASLFVCASVVGLVGLILVGLSAHRLRFRRRAGPFLP